MTEHEAKRREQWNTFAALLKAGCSIPYELRHIEREHRDRVRRMVGKIPTPFPPPRSDKPPNA